MTVFLDTSVLFKLYHRESGTDEAERLFAQNRVDLVFLSSLSRVEFRSIVWRRVRMKELSHEQANTILTLFDDDFGRYQFIEIDEQLLRLASQLIDTYGLSGLRSLDALQLASAVAVRTQMTLYKTADRLLNDLFRAEGLPV